MAQPEEERLERAREMLLVIVVRIGTGRARARAARAPRRLDVLRLLLASVVPLRRVLALPPLHLLAERAVVAMVVAVVLDLVVVVPQLAGVLACLRHHALVRALLALVLPQLADDRMRDVMQGVLRRLAVSHDVVPQEVEDAFDVGVELDARRQDVLL